MRENWHIYLYLSSSFARSESEVKALLLKNGVSLEDYMKKKEVFDQFHDGNKMLRRVTYKTSRN